MRLESWNSPCGRTKRLGADSVARMGNWLADSENLRAEQRIRSATEARTMSEVPTRKSNVFALDGLCDARDNASSKSDASLENTVGTLDKATWYSVVSDFVLAMSEVFAESIRNSHADAVKGTEDAPTEGMRRHIPGRCPHVKGTEGTPTAPAQPRSQRTDQYTDYPRTPPIEQNGSLIIPVAGVTHGNRQAAVATCSRYDRLYCVRKPDNRFDPNAIEVTAGGGLSLGWVPAAVAREFAPGMDAGRIPHSRVLRVVGGGPGRSLGLRIELSWNMSWNSLEYVYGQIRTMGSGRNTLCCEDEVVHPEFGSGTVMSVTGSLEREIAEVEFDGFGTKRLLVSAAGMRVDRRHKKFPVDEDSVLRHTTYAEPPYEDEDWPGAGEDGHEMDEDLYFKENDEYELDDTLNSYAESVESGQELID